MRHEQSGAHAEPSEIQNLGVEGLLVARGGGSTVRGLRAHGPAVASAAFDPLVRAGHSRSRARISLRIEQLRQDGEALAPMVKTELGRAFLAATAALAPAPRVLLKDPKTERYYSPTAAAKLDANVRKTLVQAGDREVIDLFYNTYHGTPLAYARAINLIGTAGVGPGAGQRLADFGFGSVGQLRMLASLGFDTIGIEVSPFLVDLYSDPADQGPFGKGSVKMTFGHFPADALVAAAVGGGLDVFLSKNTLKRGYIHPYRTPGKPEWVIKLGVTDEVFLRTVHERAQARRAVHDLQHLPGADARGQAVRHLDRRSLAVHSRSARRRGVPGYRLRRRRHRLRARDGAPASLGPRGRRR